MERNQYKYYCRLCKKIEKKQNIENKNKQKYLYYEISDHPEEHKNKLAEIPKEIRSQYIILIYLEAGGYGDVFQISKIDDPSKIYALKLCDYDPDIKNEIEITKDLSHRNIIKYIDSNLIREDKIYLITELGDNDLVQFCNSNPSHNQMYKVILEISEGLNYLHNEASLPILHLDLKLNNFVIKDGCVKIIDFGTSKKKKKKYFEDNTRPISEPNQYSPPEWIENYTVSPKTDIWAFGIIAHMIFTNRKNPFQGKDIDETMENIRNYKINFDNTIIKKSPFYKFINNCLTKDPNQRWDMKTIVKFIKENKENFFCDIKEDLKQNSIEESDK